MFPRFVIKAEAAPNPWQAPLIDRKHSGEPVPVDESLVEESGVAMERVTGDIDSAGHPHEANPIADS